MPASNSENLKRDVETAQEYSKDLTDNENFGCWEDRTEISDTCVAENPADDATKDILEKTAFAAIY